MVTTLNKMVEVYIFHTTGLWMVYMCIIKLKEMKQNKKMKLIYQIIMAQKNIFWDWSFLFQWTMCALYTFDYKSLIDSSQNSRLTTSNGNNMSKIKWKKVIMFTKCVAIYRKWFSMSNRIDMLYCNWRTARLNRNFFHF